MADSLTDVLTGTIRTVMILNRTDTQEIGSYENAKTLITDYRLGDGPLARQADLVYAATRTVPANTMEEFDLSDLEQTTLGTTVPFEFAQVRAIKVRNTSTVSGRRLLIGVSPGSPTSVYAAEIGPGSEWFAVNYENAWQVTDANKMFRLSNPNAAAVTYEFYVFGTATPPPTPTGPSGPTGP
jgi:hypothetical protein